MPNKRLKRKRSSLEVVLTLKDDSSYLVQEGLRYCCTAISDHLDSPSSHQPLEVPDVFTEGVKLLEYYWSNYGSQQNTDGEAFLGELTWEEKIKVVVAARRLGYADLFVSISRHINKAMSEMIKRGEREKVLELLQLKSA
eukprot:jgi/Botrbrau1/14632/Bobra.0364s0016.1